MDQSITQQRPSIATTPMQSSNIKASGYDGATKTLRIEFHSGSIYDYEGVAPEVAAAFAEAKSPGGFHAASIRGKYTAALVKAKGDTEEAAS